MSAVLSNDPLTHALLLIGQMPLTPYPTDPGYGTPSQQGHVADWNSRDGIRFEAAMAGFLTARENHVLKEALDRWPWLAAEDRKTVNRVVTMLFTIRKRLGFATADRDCLNDYPEFRLKPKKNPTPSGAWRRSRAQRRSSFASI